MMEMLVVNLLGRVRRVIRNGRRYLVAPLTSIVPGVLAGSQGPLLYPHHEIARNVGDWDGIPLVVYHPSDPLTNEHLSATAPGVLDRQGIGTIRNSVYRGKLCHEGWFDEERTQKVDNRVYQALVDGKQMELSTGLFTDNQPAPKGSTHNGRPYSFIARNYRPDHMAILPDQVGACSINDGCGVLVNANPEGHNQYTAGGGFHVHSEGVLRARAGINEYRIGQDKETGNHHAVTARVRPNGKLEKPTKIGEYDTLKKAKDAVIKHGRSKGRELIDNRGHLDCLT